MSTQNASYPDTSFEAYGDLSTRQFCIMAKNSTARQVFTANSVDDIIVGVLQNKPAAIGRTATVRIGGIAKVKAGGTIAAGDRVGTDANGRAIKLIYSNGALASQLGIAMTAATAANELVEVLVMPITVHQGAAQA